MFFFIVYGKRTDEYRLVIDYPSCISLDASAVSQDWNERVCLFGGIPGG